jgi:chaperone required for assembly of F1-ATPase
MNRPFTLILIADVTSATGSQITLVAMPLTALLLLHAKAWQIAHIDKNDLALR